MTEIIGLLRNNINEHNIESAKLKFIRKTNFVDDVIMEEDEEYEDSILEDKN